MGATEVKNKKKGIRGLGRTKNRKNWVSDPLDEQKTRKIGFPTPRMNKKREKLTFQPLG